MAEPETEAMILARVTIVQTIDDAGNLTTAVETETPDGESVPMVTLLGMLEVAKADLLASAE